MRSIRLLAAGLTIFAVTACATTTPGWTYAPAPSATALPSVDPSASAGPSDSAAPSASAAAAPSASPTVGASPAGSAAGSGAPSGSPSASAPTAVVDIAAQNIAFDKTELNVAPDLAFQIVFDNNEAVPHNVEIKDAAGASVFMGEIFSGPGTRTYDVQPLPAGTYPFVCSVHSNMTGTLTAQ